MADGFGFFSGKSYKSSSRCAGTNEHIQSQEQRNWKGSIKPQVYDFWRNNL